MSAKLSTAASVTAIAAVAAAITGGTYAHFSDTDTREDYQLTNGTTMIDLTNDGTNTATAFKLGNLQPGDTSNKDINVENVGTLPGTVKISLVNVSSLENSCVDPEGGAGNPDTTCDATSAGELAQQLKITITKPDGSDDGTAADVVYDGLLSNYVANDAGFALTPFQTATDSGIWNIKWEFVNDSADAGDTIVDNNVAQSDSVEFDVQFVMTDDATTLTGTA
jgi:predicted ribosomally synthesized peptide with SipW-like signal peptide